MTGPEILARICIFLGAVAGMELFAWWAHKHVMHGWGWAWHRSHHEPRTGAFERNDLYAIVFAGVAIVLIALGSRGDALEPLRWVGAGMTAYGFLYALVHDGLVHKRWPWRWVPRSGYLKRLYQAHRLHHAMQGREGGVSFGFLWAPRAEVLKAELQRQRGAQLTSDA